MYYIKIKDNRYNLVDNGIDIGNGNVLTLGILAEKHSFDEIKEAFGNIENEITVYGSIIQEDGKETDEFVSNVIPTFTVLKGIFYDLVEDIYTVQLLSPSDLELRLHNLEKSLDDRKGGADYDSRITALEKAIDSINEKLDKLINNQSK